MGGSDSRSCPSASLARYRRYAPHDPCYLALGARIARATGDIEHDSHLYLGTGLSRGDLCVCPLLQSWIAEQLSAESAILKEQRKAHEERTLTRGGGGGGGNHRDGEKGGKKKTDDKK